MALTLGEDRHKHVRARHFIATRAFNVQDRALDNTLEGGCRADLIIKLIYREVGQLVINIIGEVVLKLFEIDFAGRHHFNSVLIICECQKQMLKRRVFVAPFGSQREGFFKSVFEAWGQ